MTVRRYRDLTEALVARSVLDSAGIHAFVRDKNLVRLEWQVSQFIGGIRLQVEPDDEQEATTLLNQPFADSMLDFGGEAEYAQPRCPRCHSAEIAFEGSSRGLALASLYLFSLPLPLGKETWLCHICGARWEDTEQDGSLSENSPLT